MTTATTTYFPNAQNVNCTSYSFSGSVGIGITTPGNALQVVGNGGSITVSIANNGDATMLIQCNNASNYAYYRMATNSGGYNTCLGTTNAGTVFVWGATSSVGVQLTNNSTAWGVYSDRTMKKNIKPLEYGLKEICALNPVRFDYLIDKTDASTRMGLVAQDVKEIIPEVVTGTGTDDDKYSLAASELIPTMINAIKELQEQVKALQLK